MATSTVPLKKPRATIIPSADTVMYGQMIAPTKRIRFFSSDDWEEFTLEWVDSLEKEYESVERCGGAGDMGRDVIGFVDLKNDIYDNFQCKHYEHPLRPTDIWSELGKLVYYTYTGEFSCPRAYKFVAPQGAGTKLSNLLRKPNELKLGLEQNWDTYCKSNIKKKINIPLDKNLLKHLNTLDFGIFSALTPITIIKGHAKTRWYTHRFGGGLPPHPPIPTPPNISEETQLVYIKQLWHAYSDHLQADVTCIDDLSNHPRLIEHLDDSRRQFYSAEALRTLSRDSLPPGTFESLQDEIHDGVKDDVRAQHKDGYECVVTVVKTSRTLQITSNPLVSRLTMLNRGGICHQLANEGKITWVK